MSTIARQQTPGDSTTTESFGARTETPTIKGVDGGIEYIHNRLKVRGVSWRMLRTAAERREVAVFMLGKAYWFSEQGLYDWVMSRREGGAQQ